MAGKNVTFNVRVPEDVARAIDEARAGQSRSSWVAGVIEAALAAAGDPPVEFRSRPERKRVEDGLGSCPHPRARVIKGFCYRCGKPATYN